MVKKRENRIVCRIILTVLTLLWMLVIFTMSGADKDESNAQSGSICRYLCETFVDGFEEMDPEEQLAMEEALSFPVRKCAHLTEYAILGVLLSLTISSYVTDSDLQKVSKWVTVTLPFIIGFLYAVSDEIHQLSVPGRSGQLRDVLIDSTGVLIGICALNLTPDAGSAVISRQRKDTGRMKNSGRNNRTKAGPEQDRADSESP